MRRYQADGREEEEEEDVVMDDARERKRPAAAAGRHFGGGSEDARGSSGLGRAWMDDKEESGDEHAEANDAAVNVDEDEEAVASRMDTLRASPTEPRVEESKQGERPIRAQILDAYKSAQPIPIPLIPGYWEPRRKEDEFCFMCIKQLSASRAHGNPLWDTLKHMLSQCGEIPLPILCPLIQRFYNNTFRWHDALAEISLNNNGKSAQAVQKPLVPTDVVPALDEGLPEWTCASIQDHMLEHSVQPETIRRVTRATLFKLFVTYANNGAVYELPGQKGLRCPSTKAKQSMFQLSQRLQSYYPKL